jgi:hypothetical protein
VHFNRARSSSAKSDRKQLISSSTRPKRIPAPEQTDNEPIPFIHQHSICSIDENKTAPGNPIYFFPTPALIFYHARKWSAICTIFEQIILFLCALCEHFLLSHHLEISLASEIVFGALTATKTHFAENRWRFEL